MTPLGSMLQLYQKKIDSLESQIKLLETLLYEERAKRRCVNGKCSNIVETARLYGGHSLCTECEKLLSVQRSRALIPQGGDNTSVLARVDCKHGHKLTPDNIYISPRGYVACKTCKQESGRKRAEKRKAIRKANGGFQPQPTGCITGEEEAASPAPTANLAHAHARGATPTPTPEATPTPTRDEGTDLSHTGFSYV